MNPIEEIVSGIERLTLVEVAELKAELEKRFGVMATPQFSPAFTPTVAEPVIEKQTEFSVTLVSAGEMKINIIKMVREVLGLDLKSSKEFVDSAPKVIKGELTEDEANQLKAKFTSAGATVTIE